MPWSANHVSGLPRSQRPGGPDRETGSCLGLLAELLLGKCDGRARRRSEGRIKAAGCPRDKSLRKFDFEANPDIGDSETGKSHLLFALGTEATMAGFRVNKSFSGWTKAFTDHRLCAAIVDRLATTPRRTTVPGLTPTWATWPTEALEVVSDSR
ncbi:hypothetical protein ACXNSR_35220 [Streptomyces sp. NC-S4]